MPGGARLGDEMLQHTLYVSTLVRAMAGNCPLDLALRSAVDDCGFCASFATELSELDAAHTAARHLHARLHEATAALTASLGSTGRRPLGLGEEIARISMELCAWFRRAGEAAACGGGALCPPEHNAADASGARTSASDVRPCRACSDTCTRAV